MKGLHFELFCQKLNITQLSSLSKVSAVIVFFLAFSIISIAQNITITDDKSVGLAHVLVYNEDKSMVDYSGKDGVLVLTQKVKSLTFSLIGYKEKKLEYEEIAKNDFWVILESEDLELSEVVILGRNEQNFRNFTTETKLITAKDIQLTNSQSTADVLAASGNIFVQKSQFGGGSPVLRGFEANRILLVLDGIRMNNAIYRNGHLQNSITVDNFSLRKVEVVFGSGSLMYGSDAIGGVIHFLTKQPIFGTKSIDYKLRYSSAANEKTGFLGFNVGNKKLAFNTILSYSDYSNLQTGNNRHKKYSEFGKRNTYVTTENGKDKIVKNDNPNIQVGTGYSQYNISSKLRYKVNDDTELIGAFQYSFSSDVPRYDFLTEKKNGTYKFAEWYYGPQSRMLGYVELKLFNSVLLYDNATTILSVQKINEDRINRKFGNVWKKHNEERVLVSAVSADFHKKLTETGLHSIYYGLDFQHNDLNSSAYKNNVKTGEKSYAVLTRYPSGFAQSYRIGSYIQYVIDNKYSPYNINLGFRTEYHNIDVRYEKDNIIDWHSSYYSGVNNSSFSSAFSIGGKYRFDNDFTVASNISKAFRNPNIDDLAKIRIKNGQMLVPNTDLKPEESYNIELSIDKKIKIKDFGLKISSSVFFTQLDNAIVRAKYNLPDGSDIFVQDADTFRIYANQNVEKERVYGVSMSLDGRYKPFNLSANVVYTKGDMYDEEGKKRAAPHIPPLFGKFNLGYTNDALKINFMANFNGAKPIELYGGSVDNPEYATIDGTYAWITYNLYLSYNLNKKIKFDIGLENITDLHYRTFSSGVSAPGRNIIVGVSGRI